MTPQCVVKTPIRSKQTSVTNSFNLFTVWSQKVCNVKSRFSLVNFNPPQALSLTPSTFHFLLLVFSWRQIVVKWTGKKCIYIWIIKTLCRQIGTSETTVGLEKDMFKEAKNDVDRTAVVMQDVVMCVRVCVCVRVWECVCVRVFCLCMFLCEGLHSKMLSFLSRNRFVLFW